MALDSDTETKLRYGFLVTPAFAENNEGKGFAVSDDELLKCIKYAMAFSPYRKVLIEEIQGLLK